MKSWPIFLMISFLAAAGGVHADSGRVVVRGFEYKEVDTYEKDGKPLGKAPASAFTFPLVSTESGVAKSVGLPYRGGLVFVRRPQLRIEDGVCASMPAQSSPNSITAGARASMGEGVSCLIPGPDNR